MKKIKAVLMVAVTYLLVSCGGANNSYESVALSFIETAGALNAKVNEMIMTALVDKNLDIDEDELVAKLENVMDSLLGMSCYNGELVSKENKEAMGMKVGDKVSEIEMESCEVLRAAELRDGTVAYVQIGIIKSNFNTVTSKIDLIMKKVYGKWKVELNNSDSDILDIQKEFEAKMSE